MPGFRARCSFKLTATPPMDSITAKVGRRSTPQIGSRECETIAYSLSVNVISSKYKEWQEEEKKKAGGVRGKAKRFPISSKTKHETTQHSRGSHCGRARPVSALSITTVK